MKSFDCLRVSRPSQVHPRSSPSARSDLGPMKGQGEVGPWSEESQRDLGPRRTQESGPRRAQGTLVRGDPKNVVFIHMSSKCMVVQIEKWYAYVRPALVCIQHACVRPEDDIHQPNRPNCVKFPETASARVGLGIRENLSFFAQIEDSVVF